MATATKPVTKPVKKQKPVRQPTKAQAVKVKTTTTEKPVQTLVTVSDNVVETPAPLAPAKNASALNLLHTPALLQLANKDDQNEVVSSQVTDSVVYEVAPQQPETTMEKVTLITADKSKPRPPVVASSEPESATPIQDPGIQSSISYITGQLSEIPVTTIVSNTKRPIAVLDSTSPSSETTVVRPNQEEEEEDEGGFIQIVDNFGDDDDKTTENQFYAEADDSESNDDDDEDDDESTSASVEGEKDQSEDDDSADDDEDDSEDDDDDSTTEKVETVEIKKKKKKTKDDDDDDILGLSTLSETFGFGDSDKKKNKVKADKNKEPGVKKKDEDDILGLGTLSDTLGLRRFGARHNGRQNKMMRIQ